MSTPAFISRVVSHLISGLGTLLGTTPELPLYVPGLPSGNSLRHCPKKLKAPIRSFPVRPMLDLSLRSLINVDGKNFSCEIRQAAEREGKYPKRLFLPKLEEPSVLILAVTRMRSS